MVVLALRTVSFVICPTTRIAELYAVSAEALAGLQWLAPRWIPEPSSHPAFFNQIFDLDSFERQSLAQFPDVSTGGLRPANTLLLAGVWWRERLQGLFKNLVNALK